MGCLSPIDYKKYVLPFSKKIIQSIPEDIPVIHFGTGTSGFLELLKEAGGDIIGVDWRINLDDAWERLGYDVGVQGNLDPTTLFASKEEIELKVKDILDRAGNRSGHIFNLGHGILPKTPVENAKYLVDTVHKLSKKSL